MNAMATGAKAAHATERPRSDTKLQPRASKPLGHTLAWQTAIIPSEMTPQGHGCRPRRTTLCPVRMGRPLAGSLLWAASPVLSWIHLLAPQHPPTDHADQEGDHPDDAECPADRRAKGDGGQGQQEHAEADDEGVVTGWKEVDSEAMGSCLVIDHLRPRWQRKLQVVAARVPA